MLTTQFKDYAEFREMFCAGKEGRRNKVLLSYLKERDLHKWMRKEMKIADPRMIGNGDLFEMVDKVIRYNMDGYNIVNIMGQKYWSTIYETDGQNGICIDGDVRAYRYNNVEKRRIYKMKIGKMFRHLIDGSDGGRLLPEPVKLWMCEEVTRRWEVYASSKLPGDNLTLHVDDDFYAIYGGTGRCKGDFGSCMKGGDHSDFYRDAVKAKAAYLTDEEDKIVSRCIIFTEVKDVESGEVVRLAERQYSTDGDELLKRLLVQKLIDAGEIDGYKRVGAGCHDANAFASNSGESWEERKFRIKCYLDFGDVLSYQDSFKWYDNDARVAYNYSDSDAEDRLDETDDYFGEGNYDEYHEEYTESELTTVYVHGRAMTCADDYMDDFVYVCYGSGRNEYHHEDDVVECVDIDEKVLKEDAWYSDFLDEYYYYDGKMYEDEREEHESLGHVYAEYNDEWLDEDDVTTWVLNDGRVQTISRYSVERAVMYNRAIKKEGVYYEAA